MEVRNKCSYNCSRKARIENSLFFFADGTQSIAWRVNADTFRADVERDARIRAHQAELAPKQRKGRKSTGKQTTPEDQSPSATPDWDALVGRRGLKISYGSLHDIESFPCEDGDKDKVSDASVCLEGAHGQWIQNGELYGVFPRG